MSVKEIRRMVVCLGVFAALCAGAEAVCSRTYTTDADFDEGILVGVEHETVRDQLQVSEEHVILPYIWVPNLGEGTVSKVHTETGDELGRYRVAPYPDCSPSRTTVDLQGNCWVGNRQAGTVVKIGLYEAGQWIDRNEDNVCQTSQDLNSDGDITGAELLSWGEDECVLYEVVLIPGMEGTYAPGDYLGEYDSGFRSTSPRGLAIDASNNLWAGTWSTSRYYYIDGSTGTILKTVDVSDWDHHAYGAVIDGNGILWSSGQEGKHVLRLDPSTDPPTIGTLHVGHFVYGLGLDYLDHLFVSAWCDYKLSRVNVSTGVIEWTAAKKYELYGARGVACTGDNDVWVANTYPGHVCRYDNEGKVKALIGVGSPTGVAVDAAGKVWSCNLVDDFIKRIDPATNTVDLEKEIIGSGGHYSYSDMTGMIARTITTKIGTWTVVFDSQEPHAPWDTISWTSHEPEGTSVTVKIRSSNDQETWSAWETATNGVGLAATPDGQYLEIETTLQIVAGDVSPVLYDVTVQCAYLEVAVEVAVDIKPESCPNPLNKKKKGVLPVAILGTEDFDVATIDPATILLTIEGSEEGVSPLRWDYEDVATPFEGEEGGCHGLGADGFEDLTLKFSAPDIVNGLDLCVFEDGKVVELIIVGNLLEDTGGMPIKGSDWVVILEKPGSRK